MQCGALAHLPLEDLSDGIKHIKEKFAFEDDKGKEFKLYFIQYIKDIGSMAGTYHRFGTVFRDQMI